MSGRFKEAINLYFISMESEGLPTVLVLEDNLAALKCSVILEGDSEETKCIIMC